MRIMRIQLFNFKGISQFFKHAPTYEEEACKLKTSHNGLEALLSLVLNKN